MQRKTLAGWIFVAACLAFSIGFASGAAYATYRWEQVVDACVARMKEVASEAYASGVNDANPPSEWERMFKTLAGCR